MANEKFSQEKAYRIMLKRYPDVLDMKQMCEILGISLKTGYGLIQENKIECLKVGRSYRIPKPFLLSYLRIGVSNE
jgi:excisionase family DNA binding protein